MVSDYDTRRATRYLPHVAVATMAVAVMPVAVVWWLRSRGVIASPWVALGLAMGLSLGASRVGRAYWKRRRGPRDLLFGELLVWGWLRRVRMERQLARSMDLLRGDEPPGADVESASRRFHLLSQLAGALEAQDAYTDGHSRRVAAHAALVARRLGLSGEELARVRAAAAVHDIGKVRVPLDVLDKPRKLTSAEFELVKAHAEAGAEIVACLGDPELTAIVRHHHERFDGNGYPSGLAYEQIPLGARIIAVADTFDALTSVRPYRPAASHKRALETLVEASGSQLDPVAVRAFLRCYSSNKAVVFWTLLTVSPQRVVAWLGGKRPAPSNASVGSMTATIGALAAIGITAISAPTGPGSGAYGLREVQEETHGSIAAAQLLPSTSVPRPTSHHIRYRSSAALAPHHRQAAQQSGRVFAARRGAANRSPAGPRSAHPGASGGPFGGKPGAGPRGQRSGGSGGKPRGGPLGQPRGGPAGGSKGLPGGVHGGGLAGGANGGALGGQPPGGPVGGSGGGSAAGSPNASGSGSRSGSASGSRSGSGSGSRSGSGSGSRSGSAGGSNGSSGAGSGGTGTGTPTSKDQCKNDGYIQYGFRNQGQCVAAVE